MSIDTDRLKVAAPKVRWPASVRFGRGWLGPIVRFAEALGPHSTLYIVSINELAGFPVVKCHEKTPHTEKAIDALEDECAKTCSKCGAVGAWGIVTKGFRFARYAVRCLACRRGKKPG